MIRLKKKRRAVAVHKILFAEALSEYVLICIQDLIVKMDEGVIKICFSQCNVQEEPEVVQQSFGNYLLVSLV